MTALEVTRGYPDDQIYGIGAASGWLWFGTAAEMADALEDLDEKLETTDRPLSMREAASYPSVFDPVIFIKIDGDENLSSDKTYFDYDDFRERAHKEKVVRKKPKICAQGAANLADAVVADAIKEYRRDLNRLKRLMPAWNAKIQAAQELYIYAAITGRPPYFCDACKDRLKRAERGNRKEYNSARAVKRAEKWLTSDDFGFYCDADGGYVIKKLREEVDI